MLHIFRRHFSKNTSRLLLLEKFQNFYAISRKEFEEYENVYLDLSTKDKQSQVGGEIHLAIELLKNRILALERQLIDKSTIKNFLLQKKNASKSQERTIVNDQIEHEKKKAECVSDVCNTNMSVLEDRVLSHTGKKIHLRNFIKRKKVTLTRGSVLNGIPE